MERLPLNPYVRSVKQAENNSSKPAFLLVNPFLLDDKVYFDYLYAEEKLKDQYYEAYFITEKRKTLLEVDIPPVGKGLYEGKALSVRFR